MTAPDAPTAMTLEEATALHGLTFVRNLDDSAWVAGRIRFLSPHDHSKYAHSWEPLGVGATWAEAASQALGYPVVERDPTAELVQENTELRRILSECASAAGGAAAPTCSLEFFAALPREIELVRHKDTAELVEALRRIAEHAPTEPPGEYADDKPSEAWENGYDTAHHEHGEIARAALARHRGEP